MKQYEQDRAEKIALFRHGVISPVLYDREDRQNEYFRECAAKEHMLPHLGIRKYSVSTFKSWLANYKKTGYNGLLPKTRRDKGSSRKIFTSFADILRELQKEHYFFTYSQLHRHLISTEYIKPYDFILQTLIKFMKDNQIPLKVKEIVPRKRFETMHINDLWICDFMESFAVYDGKKKRRVYLCSIIDDHSRVIVGYIYSHNESFAELENVFKSALSTYGIPLKFYCDNGKVFHSKAIHTVCAKLGIALIHSRPYDSPSRGKIERFFRTVQTKFNPTLDKNKITLSELNTAFGDWLNKDYHRIIHAGIGEKPIDRFMRSLEQVKIRRVPQEALELVFYLKLRRKVKKDCTVSVNGKLYEAPSSYIDQEIDLRYSSSSPEELFIFEDDKPVHKLRTLDVHLNANPPHVNISFSSFLKKEDNNNVS